MRVVLFVLLLSSMPAFAEDLVQASKEQKEYLRKLGASTKGIPSYRLKGPQTQEGSSSAASQTQKSVFFAEPEEAQPVEGQAQKWIQMQTRAKELKEEIQALQKDIDSLATVDNFHGEYRAKKDRLDVLKAELERLREVARQQNVPPGYVR